MDCRNVMANKMTRCDKRHACGRRHSRCRLDNSAESSIILMMQMQSLEFKVRRSQGFVKSDSGAYDLHRKLLEANWIPLEGLCLVVLCAAS